MRVCVLVISLLAYAQYSEAITGCTDEQCASVGDSCKIANGATSSNVRMIDELGCVCACGFDANQPCDDSKDCARGHYCAPTEGTNPTNVCTSNCNLLETRYQDCAIDSAGNVQLTYKEFKCSDTKNGATASNGVQHRVPFDNDCKIQEANRNLQPGAPIWMPDY